MTSPAHDEERTPPVYSILSDLRVVSPRTPLYLEVDHPSSTFILCRIQYGSNDH
jgi:hypothetical protein